MQCLDFERTWNERLDARGPASAALQGELDAHAAICPACRRLAARYQLLQHVLRTVAAPPTPPPEFLPRFLQTLASEPQVESRRLKFRRAWAPLALAASFLMTLFLAGRWLTTAPDSAQRGLVGEAAPKVGDAEPPGLTDALATAGSATWEFARETSAPAARLGREFLEVANLRETFLPDQGQALVVRSSAARPEPVPADPGAADARDLPFTGTARQAFGFLLGPPSASGDSAATSPTSG